MSHFFISLCVFQQRATLTKQASFHQSKVSSWLHSSEEMSKCSKGAVCFLLFLSLQRNHHCIFILLFVFFCWHSLYSSSLCLHTPSLWSNNNLLVSQSWKNASLICWSSTSCWRAWRSSTARTRLPPSPHYKWAQPHGITFALSLDREMPSAAC